MELDALIRALAPSDVTGGAPVDIRDLSYDTRRVTQGALFFCVPGARVDGHDLGELVGLTTIAQVAYQQGFDAALLLLEMINGAPVPESLTYPTELVRRGSTAPLRDRR